jgi:CRISPR-associated endonuclease/helicase Cas3
MVNNIIYSFWGKAEKDGNGYHPAVLHMIDVGLVARELLKTLPRHLQERILSLFGTLGEKGLVFFAALHDIGKISPGFQQKREDLCMMLKDTDLGFPIASEKSHGKIAASCLPEILAEEFACPDDAAQLLSTVLAAHHGTFVSYSELLDGGKKWESARRGIARFLAGVFQVETLESIACPSIADALILAGLLTAADWLGSSEDHFSFSGGSPIEMPSYIKQRSEIAKSLVRELAMDSIVLTDKPFKELFSFEAPNPCQRAALEVVSQLNHPMLLIVESPMGSGKTEAAQAAFAHLAPRNKLRGMYYALPTQATGNAMFNRTKSFLEKLDLSGQAQLHLLHANADINPDYEGLKVKSINDDSNKEEGNVVASSWFTARKKGILASYATGTVDQALLAALRVRHFFLRVYGLSGKFLVLDEVHAYDAYMTEEITRLIGWLANCETSVILLSATLPKKRRLQLLQAFAPGAQIPLDIRYPCVLGVDANGMIATKNIENQVSPPLTLEPQICTQTEKAATVVRLLKDKLAEGGCAACILNTVTEAQSVYEAVKSEIKDTENIILFHSRFTLEHRLKIEAKILSLYKKGGDRPLKGIVIATQVLEQSLDLDFDLMISDIAPIDLLFQRAGRLHRFQKGGHDKNRPPLLNRRVLYVLMPDILDGKPDFGGSTYVYFPDILTRTAYLLIEENSYKSRIANMPDGISELIEKVYGDEDILVSERLQHDLEKWNEERMGKEYASRYAAMMAAVKDAWACVDDPNYLAEMSNDNDDERIISTRIARPTVTLILVEKGESLHVGNKGDAKRLYAQSLTTDNVYLVRHFREQESLPEWKDAPLLRHCYPLVLSEKKTSIDGKIFRYDKEFGLRIIKETR